MNKLDRILFVCAAIGVTCIAASAVEFQDASQDKLYSAIRANDLPQIKTLLDEGARANAESSGGVTPLMAAAEIGSVEAMKMLIERGAGFVLALWLPGSAHFHSNRSTYRRAVRVCRSPGYRPTIFPTSTLATRGSDLRAMAVRP